MAEKELDDLWGEDEVRDRREGSISNSNSGDDNIGVSVYKVINSKTNDDFNRNQSYRNSDHDNPNDERNENFGRNNGLRDDKLDRGISHSRGDANYTEGSNGRYSRDCTRENLNNDDIHHSSSSSNIVGSSRGAHLSNRGFESGHDEDRDGAPLWEREKPSLSSNSRNHSIKGDSYISNGRNFNSNNMWGDDDSEVGRPVDNTWSAGSDRQLPLPSEGVIVSDNLWGDSDEIWGIPEVQNTRQLTSHESISIPQFVPEKGIPYTPSAFLWDGAAQPERGRITRSDYSRSDDKQVDAPINSTRRGNSNNSYHSSATEDNMDYGRRDPSLDSGVHYHSADKRVRFEEEESASVRKECPSVDYNYARSSSNTSYSNFESQSSSPPLDGSLFCALPSTSPSDDGNLQCSTTFGGPLGTFFTSTDRQEDSDEEDHSDNNSSPGRESSNVNISRWGVDDDAVLSLNSNSRDRQNDSSSVVVNEVENSSSVWDF